MSPYPKNPSCVFRRDRLKPLANQKRNPFGVVVVGDKLGAGELGSLPCLSRYSLLESGENEAKWITRG